MVSLPLLMVSSALGQYFGYYGRTPLPLYDPVRYARYYSGSGFYTYAPPAVYPPRVIIPYRSVSSLPGITGRVLELDERRKLIMLRGPAETIQFRLVPSRDFARLTGAFPRSHRACSST